MNEAPSGQQFTRSEKTIGEVFRISVFLKGIHAIIEIVGGILLLFISPSFITQMVVALTQDELRDDPNDFISNYLVSASAHISLSTTIFGGLYLLSHGIIKIILVWGLLKNRTWAYPWSLIVLGLFIAYQVYRYTFTHSFGLVILTAFDLVVLWLIWREYRIMKHHQGQVPQQI